MAASRRSGLSGPAKPRSLGSSDPSSSKREMVFRLEGQPTSRRIILRIERRRAEIFALKHPISPLRANHTPGDFQDGRLRHKIVACFARAYSLKSAGHAHADWPGDS